VRLAIFLAVTFAALAWALAGPVAVAAPAGPSPKPDCPSSGTESAVVAAAADATTLRLKDGRLVRLAGIDVPVSLPETAAELAALLPPKTAVNLAPTVEGRSDRYGRRHAFVFVADGRTLQAALVAAGAARARWLPGDSACFPELLALERRARAGRLGLWADSQAILSADDPSLLQRSGLYEVVAGRLYSVGHGTPITFLDFGRSHRQDFTVMLSASVAKALTATLGSVDSLVGERLLVRGVIESSGGAAMRLNNAAEIELLDDQRKP